MSGIYLDAAKYQMHASMAVELGHVKMNEITHKFMVTSEGQEYLDLLNMLIRDNNGHIDKSASGIVLPK